MYYPDLTPYEYFDRYSSSLLFNVGWLDSVHPFPTQEPTPEFVGSLWEYCRYSVQMARGFHACELCSADNPQILTAIHAGRSLELGFAEIRVFSSDGQAYAAPNLIFHYVTEHGYAPPVGFMNGVLYGPRPGTPEYVDLLKGTCYPSPLGFPLLIEE